MREEMFEELFNPEIYTKALGLVRAYVIGKSGALEDAQDIFHEGLMIFMRKASNNQLKLTCPPEVYILGICKNLWRKRKPAHENQIVHNSMEEFMDNSGEHLKLQRKREGLIALIEKHIKNLSQKCQELFKYKMEGLTCEEIAQKMKMDSDQISRNKMYTCKKRLWELIEQDPEFRKINDNE